MGSGDGGGAVQAGDAAGGRERAALSAAIRGLADAPDLATAAVVVTEAARRLLGAEHGVVVRIDGGDPVVTCAVGRGGPPEGQAMLATGALATALAVGRRTESRRAGVVEIAAPVGRPGRPWGAILLTGPQAAVPEGAAERLCPFADLLTLAATTHETRRRLASLAGTDPLTGLGNRRAFDDLLEAEVGRARRHGDPLSLVLLDIDHFKAVNDRFGHQRGDRVLVEVGRRLVAIARRGETVARIGGEEFAWVLPRTPGAGAECAARRARDAVASAPFDVAGRLTISAGVCDLATADSAEEMVRVADRMLYRAKADGRDAVRCAAPVRDDAREPAGALAR